MGGGYTFLKGYYTASLSLLICGCCLCHFTRVGAWDAAVVAVCVSLGPTTTAGRLLELAISMFCAFLDSWSHL